MHKYSRYILLILQGRFIHRLIFLKNCTVIIVGEFSFNRYSEWWLCDNFALRYLAWYNEFRFWRHILFYLCSFLSLCRAWHPHNLVYFLSFHWIYLKWWMAIVWFIVTYTSLSRWPGSLIIGYVGGRHSLVTYWLIILNHLIIEVLLLTSTFFTNDVAYHIKDKAYNYFQSLIGAWAFESIQVWICEIFIMYCHKSI